MNPINEDWFVIKDFESFVNHSRNLVFDNYGPKDKETDCIINTNEKTPEYLLDPQDKEELDRILSYAESVTIIKSFTKKQINKKNNKTRFIINEDLYLKALQSMGDRITSNILHGLVNKGLIEMAFDDDSNDFVFWIKEKNKLEE